MKTKTIVIGYYLVPQKLHVVSQLFDPLSRPSIGKGMFYRDQDVHLKEQVDLSADLIDCIAHHSNDQPSTPKKVSPL